MISLSPRSLAPFLPPKREPVFFPILSTEKRAHLTDLIHERFPSPGALHSKVNGKPARGSWLVIAIAITRAGALVEHIVAQDQDGTRARLLMTADGVQFRPADVRLSVFGPCRRIHCETFIGLCLFLSYIQLCRLTRQPGMSESIDFVGQSRLDGLASIWESVRGDEGIQLS